MAISSGYNARKLFHKIIQVLKAGWVPNIQSSPGMGKSSIMKMVAEELNLKLIDHRLSTSAPEDLTGLPYFTADGKAMFFPFADLFPLADTPLPENKDGWLIFLDEFNSAPKSVQAAAYKLILDRQVGQYDMHPKVYIATAGNLITDRSIVNPIATAMQSRLIHMELALDFNVWLEDVAIKHNYDERIIGFLSYKNGYLFDFRPDHNNKTFACPRTWQMMDSLVKVGGVDDDDLHMFSGTVGPGVATEFITYVKNAENLVRKEDILFDPDNCTVPSDTQLLYATVTHMLSEFTEECLPAFITYLNRLDFRFRVLFMRGIAIRFPDLTQHPDYRRGAIELAKYLRD